VMPPHLAPKESLQNSGALNAFVTTLISSFHFDCILSPLCL
jgi:hypothetical protein